MSDWKEDPPVVVEHTTVNPVVERTVIERDAWYSEPWMLALLIGAIAIIGLVSYWAIYTPNSQPTVISRTTIEKDVPRRAETIVEHPVVVTQPPATNVTVTPPATPNPVGGGQPPVSTTSGGSPTTMPNSGGTDYPTPNQTATTGDNDSSTGQ